MNRKLNANIKRRWTKNDDDPKMKERQKAKTIPKMTMN